MGDLHSEREVYEAVKSPVQGQIGPWGEIALLALFSLKGLLKAFERLLKSL